MDDRSRAVQQPFRRSTPVGDHIDAVEIRWNDAARQEYRLCKSALEWCEGEPLSAVPPDQKAEEVVTQPAHAVVEHDCGHHAGALYRTTNNMRGKSNLPATASMMLIWQVYKPGVNDDAGTSN